MRAESIRGSTADQMITISASNTLTACFERPVGTVGHKRILQTSLPKKKGTGATADPLSLLA